MNNHVEKKESKVNYNANEIIFSKNWEQYRGKNYFEYRKNWEEYPKKRFVSDFPLHLDIETTDLCNLKCPMCPRTILDEKQPVDKSKYISKEDYIRIIDQAAMHGVKSIKLQYLGEPLLHKDVAFQVAYAKEKGIEDVMFNTNGVLLTKDLSRQLLEAGIDKIFISFDAISPKLFEQQRVGTSIGKVIDNIYHFSKLRDEISPKTFIRLSMVMYEDPIWKQQFDAMKIMWEGIVDAIGYGIFNDRYREGDPEYEKVDGFVCEQLFQRMFLKCNGNVSICCTDEQDSFKIGNWKEDNLYDLWNSKKYKEIRNSHINNNYNKYETCRKCFIPDVYRKTYLNK